MGISQLKFRALFFEGFFIEEIFLYKSIFFNFLCSYYLLDASPLEVEWETIHQMRILSKLVMQEIIVVVGALLLFILLHESITN